MRGSITALAGLWLMLCSVAPAETFPYTATVASLNVTSRSGPSYGQYPTERLARHSQVEVQKSGPAGWVAVRPPRDAFDWLPASVVKISANRKTAEVIVDSAPAYIGSNVKKVDKHASQVSLKKGDTVQILAEKTSQRSDGSAEVWLKIAPPSGEFRWVQAKHLSTKSPEQLAAEETSDRLAREDRYRRENAADPPGLLAKALSGDARDIADARRDEDVERAQFLRRGKSPLLPRKPREDSKKSGDEEIGSIEIDKGTATETLQSDDEPASSPRLTDTKPDTDPARPNTNPARPRISLDPKGLVPRLSERVGSGIRNGERPLTARDTARELPKPEQPAVKPPPVNTGSQARPGIDAEEFKRRLTQLDVDLTSMVAEDSTKWNLGELRRQAEELVEEGPSPLERGRARLVLDRINEFAATLPPNQEELVLAAPANQPPPPAAAKANLDAHYDAVGYLMPIVGARPGSPQYQLTDKDGRTLSFVSARPGVNLNHYVKKQVGLYGQRGYVESLKKPHVVAERVVDLDINRR